jgi:hypothetical protein
LLGRAGQKDLEAGIANAKRARRAPLEIACRAQLARVEVLANRKEAASNALGDVPDESADFTLGPELRAQVEYWRGAGTGDQRGQRVTSEAQKKLETLRDSLPVSFRNLFAGRADIAAILIGPDVRSHQ